MTNRPKTLPEKHAETPSSSSLDAKRLLAMGFSDISLNSSTSKQESVAWYLDAYFSFLEPLNYTNTFDIPIDKHSPEFQQRRDEVMWRLLESSYFKDGNFSKAEITTDGFLKLTMTDNTVHEYNLINMWNNATKSQAEQKRLMELDEAERKIQNQTREKEQELQESVSKQAFYGGNVIAEYTEYVAGTMATGLSLMAVGKMATGTLYALKSMVIVTEDGAKRRITFREAYIGTKQAIADGMHRILRLSGYDYDPQTRQVFSPAKRMLTNMGDDLKNLTFEKWKATPEGRNMSEKEFEHFKNRAMAQYGEVSQLVQHGRISPKQAVMRMVKVALPHIALFPLFAAEFHKNQSWANLIGAIGNEVAFWAGMKVGARVPVPGGWKILTGIGGGVLSVMGGQKLAEYLELNRHKWLNFQKSNYRHERSGFLHGISLLSTETLGGINSLWRKATSDENAGGIDVGLDKTHVMLPGTNTHLFTIPEVTFIQDKITMGTKPWEWIWSSIARDVSEWNKQVDRYKIQLTRDINELLGKYVRNESIFADASQTAEVGKEKILQQELLALLSGGDMGNVFVPEMLSITEGITAELQRNPNISVPNSTINELISRNVGAMKIDETLYARERSIAMAQSRIKILDFINTIPNLTLTQRAYLESIPERMRQNKELYENASEKNIYEGLLKNTDDAIMGEQMSVGVAFASWLDTVVDWKNEQHFLDALSRGDHKGYTWAHF